MKFNGPIDIIYYIPRTPRPLGIFRGYEARRNRESSNFVVL